MESTRPIRALVRGLEALTVLNLRDGASVSEISHEIGLPRTTVYRILETLLDSGFAYRDAADERYRLTRQVTGLRAGFADESWMAQGAGPLLVQLGEDLVWPLHLSTPDGLRLMVRETTDHRTPFNLERLHAGLHLSLTASAAGQTYLAFCSSVEREHLLESRARRTGAPAVRARPDLQRALERIRQQGYGCLIGGSRQAEELHLSVPALSAERPVAVLTIRFQTAVLPADSGIERFLPTLRQCAAKISTTFSAQQAGVRSNGAPRTAA